MFAIINDDVYETIVGTAATLESTYCAYLCKLLFSFSPLIKGGVDFCVSSSYLHTFHTVKFDV